MNPYRLILLMAGLAGLSGVILAAAGTHMIPGLDGSENFRIWQTANFFHLLHSVALLALSLIHQRSGSRATLFAALAFCAGIALFSGSIYLSLITSMSGVRQLAPAGGMLLMLGWLLIIVHSLRANPR